MSETGPKVTEGQVKAFERQLKGTLPDDYRAFLLSANGGRTDKTQRKFVLRRGESSLSWLFSLHDPDEGSRLEESTPEWVPNELLAIGSAAGGIVALCVRGDHRGSVWYLDIADARPDDANPRVPWHDRRDFIKVANSFQQFMGSLTP